MTRLVSAHPADPVRDAGAALLDALLGGSPLTGLPGAAPATLDDAYAVQDLIIDGVRPVGGWKVSPLREGIAPRCSPLPHRFFASSPATFTPGFLAGCSAEVEIALRLGTDLRPGPGSPTTAEVADAVAAVHPAIELLSSRFAEGSAAPDLHRLVDLQGSIGVVVGVGRSDWRDIEFADLSVELALDGEVRRAQRPRPSTERTLAAVGWLASHAALRGHPLRAGDIVITGARSGAFALGSAQAVHASIEALGEIMIHSR